MSMRERISMTEAPTIEELQAQLIAMKDEHEKLKTEIEAQRQEAAKSAEDLRRARELNAQLMSRVPAPQEQQPEPDPYEGMTPEQALEDILPEVVDRVAAEQLAARKAE